MSNDLSKYESKYVVGIITFQRNKLLERLLRSLQDENSEKQFSVIVVDNDPDGSANGVVEAFDGMAKYYHEPRPGIVAARNRLLDELPETAEAVIFVDDDEMVHPGWFEALTSAASTYGADVVLGPVISVFPEECPAWIVGGGFIQRPYMRSGTVLKTAATNNVLISLPRLRRLPNPRFDESFSVTGGSDAELFWRLRKAGAHMVWAADAEVEEDVPDNRANFKWVFRRTVRYGNVSGRLLLKERPPLVVAGIGVIRLVLGLVTSMAFLMTGKGLREKYFGHFAKGIGTIGASLGRVVKEYQRPEEQSVIVPLL